MTGASEDQGGPSSSYLPVSVVSCGEEEREGTNLSESLVVAEQSSGASGVDTTETSAPAMQSNGVLKNGTTGEIAVNGLRSGVLSGKGHKNGVCEGGEGVEVENVSQQVAEELRLRSIRQRQLSGKDIDIIRIIGQHLREMGFG